jgi:hypothetical protein
MPLETATPYNERKCALVPAPSLKPVGAFEEPATNVTVPAEATYDRQCFTKPT